MLLLNINEKPYIVSQMAPSYLTLGDPEMSNLMSLRFRGHIYQKGAKLGHVLLLNINRKPYI